MEEKASTNSAIDRVIKAFMLISTILFGLALVPLLWMVPMTIRVFKKTDSKETYGTALSVCSLFFVSFIAGLCMIVKDYDETHRGTVPENRKWLCMPYGLFLILFIILPIVLIFCYAFTKADGTFTLENFTGVFDEDSRATTFKVIGQSLGVAALTTVICILIAYPIAYILANSKFNKNVVLVYLFLLPMWINFVIRTVATKQLLIFFGLDPALHPWTCSIIGMVYNYLPFAILPLYNTMLKLDKSQIEAAADLGASPVQVFFKTIVPMTVPGIVSAATMTFMPTMSSYVITDALSGRTIKLIGGQIEHQFLHSQLNTGSVYAIIMLALIGLSVIFENFFSEKMKGAR